MTCTGPSPFFLANLALAAILLLPGPAAAQDDPGGAWRPPDLIDAVASFGAVAHDGALYVYGGHVGRTHAHSLENVSPGFRRLVLEPGRKWEELARGPLLQGAALVSDGVAIYRVGGMTAANATTAEPEVLHSSRSAARYSVAADRWEPLPDLPAGRSSHDAVVADGVEVVSTDAGPADDAAPERGATRWPGFRGGRDTNVSRAARLPLTWSDESVAWRAATPGFGQSSPVIWDDTVFLTSLEGELKETLFVTAIGLDDGAERWRRRFEAAEAFEWNDCVSKGAPTPAVDAERLYAFFDSGDLLALTHDGETVWRRRLGAEYGSVGGNHGVGSSVLLTDRAVVVLLTRRTYSYLLAVAPDTGETLWKADREPCPSRPTSRCGAAGPARSITPTWPGRPAPRPISPCPSPIASASTG